MTERLRPPAAVRAAFGIDRTPIEPLAGGEETSVVAGHLVLKRVQDPEVSAWCQKLLADLRPVGVAVPEPIATRDGSWTAGGWIATRFVAGLRSLRDDPALVIEAGERLTDAIAERPPADVDPVRRRADRWARADRHVWGEETVALDAPAAHVAQIMGARMRRTGPEPIAVVHGDLSANVFVDPAGIPVVLDLTPYLRPRRYAAGIVVADNLLWYGGKTRLASLLDDDDALARALLFRLVAEQLADRPRHGANVDDYHRVIEMLDWGR